ncbi:RNA-guided endonuclease TnpB family protein (plasmid) [Mycobacteroides chelonae]|jgi:putative transposase|uniref:Transposase n=2 Tax=Mycolicibacterium TaxID=1866885 RepID=A0A0M2JQ47_9MYCO|nr:MULTISPECIES: RNA-guided endonuclease TnpB family protein [Mycobacteriaceae]KKE98658.1 transposase [Mycolicibacterium obuense]OAN30701.1 transposase [Mycolicibacterium iranicum]WED89837.1 RNA-guided endonuclease TnpB family protein [Mycobacteroides chelonae]
MQMRYRYRIEPTPAQQEMLARVFGCCRVVFNDALRVRDEAYRAGMKLSDSEIQRRVITIAKTTTERAWLREVPSVALVQSVNDSRRAWRNFFDSATGKRKGRRVGRPRFKSRKDHRQSFRLTRNGFSIRDNGRLFVAKVGQVAVRWSRELPSTPSSVTIIREPDGHFYASFVVDVSATPLPVVDREAGVDVGIARLATVATTDSHRIDVENPKHLGRKLRKLRRLEREKSRRQKGSANRAKTRRKIAIAHNEVARARRDYHHKQALALVRENQVIHVEDLNIAGMVHNRRLARAISDAGWGQFVRIIGEKADRYGRTVHTVSRWLASSKTCSTPGCGHRLGELPLQVRQWTCPSCEVIHDRDHNAAKVILAAGRAERLNACGARVRPQPVAAVGVETGSTPTAA